VHSYRGLSALICRTVVARKWRAPIIIARITIRASTKSSIVGSRLRIRLRNHANLRRCSIEENPSTALKRRCLIDLSSESIARGVCLCARVRCNLRKLIS